MILVLNAACMGLGGRCCHWPPWRCRPCQCCSQTLVLCGIKLMLGEVAFCLQTLGTPQDSLCLFQSKMTYIYERELFWYIKSTKYFRERNFFRHLIASLEYPKCLFLTHCRVLSHLLHTLGQYLVFLNCENWLVLHSTLLHVWLQVTFASSKPGLLDMRN